MKNILMDIKKNPLFILQNPVESLLPYLLRLMQELNKNFIGEFYTDPMGSLIDSRPENE
jgi:hypothetical protein